MDSNKNDKEKEFYLEKLNLNYDVQPHEKDDKNGEFEQKINSLLKKLEVQLDKVKESINLKNSLSFLDVNLSSYKTNYNNKDFNNDINDINQNKIENLIEVNNIYNEVKINKYNNYNNLYLSQKQLHPIKINRYIEVPKYENINQKELKLHLEKKEENISKKKEQEFKKSKEDLKRKDEVLNINNRIEEKKEKIKIQSMGKLRKNNFKRDEEKREIHIPISVRKKFNNNKNGIYNKNVNKNNEIEKLNLKIQNKKDLKKNNLYQKYDFNFNESKDNKSKNNLNSKINEKNQENNDKSSNFNKKILNNNDNNGKINNYLNNGYFNNRNINNNNIINTNDLLINNILLMNLFMSQSLNMSNLNNINNMGFSQINEFENENPILNGGNESGKESDTFENFREDKNQKTKVCFINQKGIKKKIFVSDNALIKDALYKYTMKAGLKPESIDKEEIFFLYNSKKLESCDYNKTITEYGIKNNSRLLVIEKCG